MPDLGSAYVNIVPKAPGIENKIGTLLEGGNPAAEKAGQSFGKKIVSGLGALGLGAAVGSVLKQAFDVGGKLQQSFGGLETLYGDAADAAMDYARSAARAGISANDYAEQAVSFGAALRAAYGGNTQKAMEAANTAIMDMADNAAKMGTPLESIQAAYQGFAKGQYQLLDNLKLGYGGTKTEMERLLADARAITGVEYNIDNLGDVYEAIHVIQGELGLTGVAAGEAETTLTGSSAAVKASWENLMGALSTGEGLETAMGNLSTSVGNFATNVLTMIGEIGPQLPDLILGLADVVIENAPSFVAAGAELVVNLVTGLVERIPDIAAKIPEIWDSFKEVWDKVDWASLGTSLINLIGDGIVAAKEWLGLKFSETISKISSVVADIDWGSLGGNIVSGIINGLWNGATGLYRAVKSLISNALGAGQEEAEVGSPSKLFAREIGAWIPAGMAMGIDQNLTPVDRAVQDMIDGSVAPANIPTPAAASAGTGQSDADRIIAALQRLRLEADVRLEGDARELFKVIRSTNNTMARASTFNPLGARV